MAEEDARKVASDVVRSLFERSGQSDKVENLTSSQQQQVDKFINEFTRMLVEARPLFVFNAPHQQYSCDMPNNIDFDYLANMQQCGICSKIYCKKHHLIYCVSCGHLL